MSAHLIFHSYGPREVLAHTIVSSNVDLGPVGSVTVQAIEAAVTAANTFTVPPDTPAYELPWLALPAVVSFSIECVGTPAPHCGPFHSFL